MFEILYFFFAGKSCLYTNSICSLISHTCIPYLVTIGSKLQPLLLNKAFSLEESLAISISVTCQFFTKKLCPNKMYKFGNNRFKITTFRAFYSVFLGGKSALYWYHISHFCYCFRRPGSHIFPQILRLETFSVCVSVCVCVRECVCM